MNPALIKLSGHTYRSRPHVVPSYNFYEYSCSIEMSDTLNDSKSNHHSQSNVSKSSLSSIACFITLCLAISCHYF